MLRRTLANQWMKVSAISAKLTYFSESSTAAMASFTVDAVALTRMVQMSAACHNCTNRSSVLTCSMPVRRLAIVCARQGS